MTRKNKKRTEQWSTLLLYMVSASASTLRLQVTKLIFVQLIASAVLEAAQSGAAPVYWLPETTLAVHGSPSTSLSAPGIHLRLPASADSDARDSL